MSGTPVVSAPTGSSLVKLDVDKMATNKIEFIESADSKLGFVVEEKLHYQGMLVGYAQVVFNFRLFAETLVQRHQDSSNELIYDATLVLTEAGQPVSAISFENGFYIHEVTVIGSAFLDNFGSQNFGEIVWNGRTYFASTFVVPEHEFAILYKVDKESALALIDEQIEILIYGVIGLVLLLAVVAYFAGIRISKPVVSMAFVAHHIAKGDLNKRIEKVGDDELGVLGRTLNLMAENLTSANAGLEQRVKEKTKELKAANRHLTEMSQKLETMSLTDELTQIYNRRALNNYLSDEFQRARRDHLPITIMMVDVDYFKKFNDLYGHSAGDNALRQIAGTLTLIATRHNDIVARYGGEEFAVILPNTEYEAAKKIANDMLKGIEALSIRHEGSSVSEYITISIGSVTGVPVTDSNLNSFVKQADKALYESKSRRNSATHLKL